jgi:hypothetical protein
MTELELGPNTYRIGSLDAIKQFHLARKLVPAQIALGVSAADLAGLAKDSNEVAIMAAIMGPVAEVVAKMSEEDVNFILFTALAVVKRQQADKWASVMVNKQLMFEDLSMPHMFRLVLAVIQENLSGFFVALPGVTE